MATEGFVVNYLQGHEEQGKLIIDDILDVTGLANLDGGMAVEGGGTVAGGLTVSDSGINVTGLATLNTGASVTGNIAVTGTVDGRDVAVDGTKLDTVEENADVTDFANVSSSLAAATTAVSFNGQNITSVGNVDGRDVSADGTQLDTNTGNISTNTGNISTNTGNISTNTTKLATIEINADVTDFTNVNAALAAADATIDINGQDLTDVGDVTLDDDKVLNLNASGIGATSLLNISNTANGLMGSLQALGNNFVVQLGSAKDYIIIGDSSNIFTLTNDGIITGPSTIPTDITTGAVSGKVFSSSGALVSSRSVAAQQNHISFYDASGGQAGAIYTSGAGVTTYATSSDPELKNFADEELTIEMVKDEFTNKYIPTIHAFRFKSDPDGPLVLGHDAWEATDAKLMTGLGCDRIGPRDAELGSKYDTGEKDEEGKPIMDIVLPAGVDQGKVTPMHGLLIHDLMKQVTDLTTRLEALEAK